jgi:peptidoglycan DL-endopeptidase CwlO
MPNFARRSALYAALPLALVALVLTAALARPAVAAAQVAQTVDKPHTKKRAKKKRKSSRGLRAVQIANHLTGIPYVWGGASPRSGFDCSGLVQYVYGKLGVSLPHYTVSLYGHGRSVARSRLRPGDLVFFSGLGHVGIYAGHGKYIHAPRRGTTVRWATLASHRGYYGARRIVFN